MNEIGIGPRGLGTVGGGMLKIHRQTLAGLEAKAGCRLRLAAVADRDVTTPRAGLTLGEWPLTTDVERVLGDPAVAIVIELIGGLEPARTFILRAIAAGKHVVTANKALVATHRLQLFQSPP